MTSEKPMVVCLMGPTASGKTRLAMELVEKIPADIVSVDSAMVYKGLDIGSAKPCAEELERAPHRLIDIREPWQPYSASDFCVDAIREIKSIHAQKRIPLLVGGTMLYFKALQQGLNEMPKADQTIRQQLEQRIKCDGLAALHAELESIDPLAAKRIHVNDPQRIQRALEVYYASGKTLSEWQQDKQVGSDFNFINIALIPQEREKLRQLIALRFDQMLQDGLLAETERFAKLSHFSPDLPAARCVGYRQVLAYLRHEMNAEQMRERAIIATCQLAKRQLTWLRRWPNLIEFPAETISSESVLSVLQ